MKTSIITFDSDLGVKALKQGKVISFPTETVYGLGCIYSSKEAFDKLVKIKRRPPDKPFTLMGGNKFSFEDYAYLDSKIERVISSFVPGPLTLLLKPKEHLPYHVTLSSPTIGIRIPGLKILRDFIDRVGQPLLVPSANKSGCPPCINSSEVKDVFQGEIEYIISYEVKSSLPSTIVDFSTSSPRLIREGELSFDKILEVYNKEN